MMPRHEWTTARIGWAAVALLSIPATVYVAALLPTFTLSSAMLLLLFEVVLVALTTNVFASVIMAIVAVLSANWFLVDPHHTLAISNTDDVVLLSVFVLTAVCASVAVTRTQRNREAAQQAAFEARTLRTTVEQRAQEADPDLILSELSAQFDLDWVQLRDPGGRVIAAHGRPTALETGTAVVFELDEPLPDDYRLLAEGPPRMGVDIPMLHSLGVAALRAWEARNLATEAARAESLAATDRARSALLASVGHDLRTPIAAISVAATNLAVTGADSREHQELVTTIRESADRLDDLVANLLDMSRLEAGTLITQSTNVDVEETLLQVAAQAGSHRIMVSVPTEIPDVEADPGLLDRVLANLVSNALRHSPADLPIELSAIRIRDHVHLRVIDHGPGIQDLDPEHLFEPFQSSGDRSPSGLGLGLAIANGFTEAMGGEMTATHTPGGGLTITTSLAVAS